MTRARPRRAAALLLALAAVSLVPLVALSAVRAASRAHLDSASETHTENARLTARSLAPVLVEWASAHEASPTDERVYREDLVTVLETTIDATAVKVEALGLSGRLHTDYLSHEIADALPPTLRGMTPTTLLSPERAPRRQDPPPRPPLDATVNTARVFPTVSGDAPWAHRWLTTAGVGALNVRSAPRELLDALLVGAEPGLARTVSVSDGEIDAELARRIIDAAQESGDRAADRIPVTDRSAAWGFLITIKENSMASRWWLVAEPAPSSPAASTAQSGWAVTEFRRVLE